MNIAGKVRSVVYRRTVTGLFYRIGSKEMPLIGIHWPTKAALAQESNLSPVAGPWKNGESADVAICRQLQTEYGLIVKPEVTPLEHPPYVSEVNLKQYFWLLVELKPPVPDIITNAHDVASFGWYSPANLETGIVLMHPQKQLMFKEVLKIAINIEPDLKLYKKHFG